MSIATQLGGTPTQVVEEQTEALASVRDEVVQLTSKVQEKDTIINGLEEERDEAVEAKLKMSKLQANLREVTNEGEELTRRLQEKESELEVDRASVA